MIDDKKIEEAAINKCGFISPEFYSGAKWMQEELLKDLWHPNTEEPKENSDIVYIDEDNEFWDIDNYKSDNFDDSFGKGWKSACRTQSIYKWCYKQDLLPRKGGE